MANYYISQVDGDDSYNGLYPEYISGTDGPWLTLAKAVSGISSGDTVYFRSGTWQDERLYIASKGYTSLTTFARYPSDAVGSVIFDGTNLTPFEYEDGIINIKSTNYIKIDGIKVQNFAKSGICVVSSDNSKFVNNITETTGNSGIILYYADTCDVQYNKVYYACVHSMGSGFEEPISIASDSTNIDVSYNEIYAGNRNFGWTGGEGLNIKAGCSYIYVHHNTVDMARPDEQENDRYCMGVDGWEQETHHIYFYDNIVKNGSWGIQFNSEEGGYVHHIYAWNNIIIHIGHSNNMHGGGIGFTPYGGSPGICDYCYWWNNTIYDCYYGARFDKEEVANAFVQNNIFNSSEVEDIHFGATDEGDVTLDHNLASTDDPSFVTPGTDFHIQSDSDARDAGVTVSYPVGNNEDYDGISRPQGAAFDIGAYEYYAGTKIILRHRRLS